ncbi:hypothetical protein BH20ACT9_BH20ACT9_02170 [soil metagenome]
MGISRSTPRRRTERAMSLTNGSPLRQSGAGRTCATPGCTATLSRYNPAAVCSAHGGWTDPASARRGRSG